MKNEITINGEKPVNFLQHTLPATAAGKIKHSLTIDQIVEILKLDKCLKVMDNFIFRSLSSHIILSGDDILKSDFLNTDYFSKLTQPRLTYVIRQLKISNNVFDKQLLYRAIKYLEDNYENIDKKLERMKFNECEIEYINGFRMAMKLF